MEGLVLRTSPSNHRCNRRNPVPVSCCRGKELNQMPLTRRSFLGAASLASTSLVFGNARGAAGSSTAAARAQEADRLIASRIKMGDVAAAAFLVRQGGSEVARAYGAAKIDTPFLVASL